MEWMSDEAYCELTGLNMASIDDLVENEKLTVIVQNGIRMINPSHGAVNTVIPQKLAELSARNTHEIVVQPEFIEKTIGTIINLHEKVLDAKDETIEEHAEK